MWIFPNKYILQYYMIHSWLNLRTWNLRYGGMTVKLYVEFWLHGGCCPSPHDVQGSSVYVPLFTETFDFRLLYVLDHYCIILNCPWTDRLEADLGFICPN